MIPFHIVSGFLGSGKTTFLKRIIENYAGSMKVGIIQNEFSPANIDGVDLKDTNKKFSLLEINNGSVFCVCLLTDFARSLEKFIDEIHPEIVVMEASGLSDPTSISEILSSGSLGKKMHLASNWCIVDALNFEKTGLMKQRVSHQLRMADVVIINKTDLLRNGVEELRNEIEKVNPFAEIREACYCNTGFETDILPKGKFYLDKAEPMNRPEIHSMVIKSTRKLSGSATEDFFHEWAPRAYRIKGFVNLKSGDTLAVQCTFGDVGLKSVGKSYHPTELVALTTEFTLREWNSSFRAFSDR